MKQLDNIKNPNVNAVVEETIELKQFVKNNFDKYQRYVDWRDTHTEVFSKEYYDGLQYKLVHRIKNRLYEQMYK
ncbi:MAG: hypothetical protein LBP59_10805 [Planctomycetaceae bacterium]|jgi:hypothetical protein|nr:hypothetical protein [Planctomycetaceae bacterium]